MLDYGVTRKVARVARARAGAASLPRGRRRGVSSTNGQASVRLDHPAAVRIAARIRRESRAGGPAPSYDLLLGRVVAIDQARKAGDRPAELDALEGLGAAAGLVLDHLQRLAGVKLAPATANFGAVGRAGG